MIHNNLASGQTAAVQAYNRLVSVFPGGHSDKRKSPGGSGLSVVDQSDRRNPSETFEGRAKITL